MKNPPCVLGWIPARQLAPNLGPGELQARSPLVGRCWPSTCPLEQQLAAESGAAARASARSQARRRLPAAQRTLSLRAVEPHRAAQPQHERRRTCNKQTNDAQVQVQNTHSNRNDESKTRAIGPQLQGLTYSKKKFAKKSSITRESKIATRKSRKKKNAKNKRMNTKIT